MANPLFVRKAGDATILVVIEGTDGLLFLDPKPGDETVGVDHTLYVVVVNRTEEDRKVDIEVSADIDDSKRTKHRIATVGPGAAKVKAFKVSPKVFKGVPDGIDTIVVHYLVKVGDQVVDPDLKIQR